MAASLFTHCAWSGHFVTCIPLRMALPLVAIKYLCRPTGGPGRSRYTSHEVTAARAGRTRGSAFFSLKPYFMNQPS